MILFQNSKNANISYICGLSYFPDTLLWANQLNFWGDNIPDKIQYDFLMSSIRQRKRYTTWYKKDNSNDDLIAAIQKTYNYSQQKAREVMNILTEKQKNDILQRMNTGGLSKPQQNLNK